MIYPACEIGRAAAVGNQSIAGARWRSVPVSPLFPDRGLLGPIRQAIVKPSLL